MDAWLSQLRDDLRRLDAAGMLRRLTAIEPEGRIIRRGGRELINLAGNDYLALSSHPHLRSAAIDAIERYGVGAGASRLVTGHQPIHERVEARFAAFKHAEAALLFPTGYMANLAVLTSLAREGDLICVDKLCHASLIDAARAAGAAQSGAAVRVYPHLNLDKLERLLARHDDRAPTHAGETDGDARSTRRFIVTDSVFSMDGDVADLPALCDLADRHDAILVVDEAHATGVLGASGAGLCEAQGVSERVDIVVSTASKALGGLGGVVTARREVIDTLVNHGRSFIYTTAVPPAQAAVIEAALDVVRDEPWRRERVLDLARRVREALGRAVAGDVVDHPAHDHCTPIIPLIAGAPQAALALAAHMEAAGLFAPAIRPPTVAPGSARVRVTLRADLADDDVKRLLNAIESAQAAGMCASH